MSKKVHLFYWSSPVFENKPKDNYGDILSAYIVSQLSGNEVIFYNAPASRKQLFKKKYLMAIGSILRYASSKATVWGSGIISKDDTPGDAQYCAVRGPLSRKRIQQLGYTCPEVYGDPALVLPNYYKPEVAKKYKLGIVPHYVDYDQVQQDYNEQHDNKVIDLMTDDPLATTDEILECDAIVSSSLHGVIVAHAYSIPAIWVQFSDKLSGDNTKYADYFLSVEIAPYQATKITEQYTQQSFVQLIQESEHLPDAAYLKQITDRLLAAFPKEFLTA